MTESKKYDIPIDLLPPQDLRAKNLWTRWQMPIFGLNSSSLFLLDGVMLWASWMIANHLGTSTPGINLDRAIVPMLTVNLVTLAASGFYGTDDKLNRFAKLFKSLILAQVIVIITAFYYHPELWASPSVLLIAWVLNFLSIGGARFLLDLSIVMIRKHNPQFRIPVVLMGNPSDINNVRQFLDRSRQFKVESTIDLSVWSMQTQLDRILARIRSRKVTEVFICSQHTVENQIILFWKLKSAGIHLRLVPNQLQLPQRSAETKMIDELPTIRFKSLPVFGVSFRLKRLLDIIGSSLLLAILSPIFGLISMAISTSSPGPIFYQQDRVGLKGRRFKIWKFRTMVENASELQKELEAQNEVQGGVLFKIKEDPRITEIGKFLRKYSLDELPQLFNVLQGQMSLVGPRPLAVRDYELSIQNLEQLSQDRFLRYEVLPGITGLWQVKGRTSINSADEIFYWDMVYILQWSLSLDLRILLETIKVVVFREGSY